MCGAKTLLVRLAGLSGWTYALIFVAVRVSGTYRRRRATAWKKQEASAEVEAIMMAAESRF